MLHKSSLIKNLLVVYVQEAFFIEFDIFANKALHSLSRSSLQKVHSFLDYKMI